MLPKNIALFDVINFSSENFNATAATLLFPQVFLGYWCER
jgi:hypothetical protein